MFKNFFNKKEEEIILSPREKLLKNYHDLTIRINNLYSQINFTSDVATIDALYDGISMYSKMRANIFNQLKTV